MEKASSAESHALLQLDIEADGERAEREQQLSARLRAAGVPITVQYIRQDVRMGISTPFLLTSNAAYPGFRWIERYLALRTSE